MEKSREEVVEQALDCYEELNKGFQKALQLAEELGESSSYYCRMKAIKDKIETERRLLEEISLPCRFILEHFSLFMGKLDHTMGFQMGKIQVGRSMLNDFYIGEWGNVSLYIGNVELTWRDADYKYLFYPDKVILRPNELGKSDIYLYFSYAFKYSHILQQYQDVKNHPQVEYWHADLEMNL